MRRNGLSLRRKTSVSQKDPSKLIDKLVSYIISAWRFAAKYNYSRGNIIAMDEKTMLFIVLKKRSHAEITNGGTQRLKDETNPFLSSISVTDSDIEEAGDEIFVLDEDESEDGLIDVEEI